MDNSKTLAALIGPTLAALGVMVFLNQPALVTLVNDPNEGPMIVMISGILVLVAGLAIVRVHNRWVKDWPVIITLIGWLCILSGLLRMFFPLWVLEVAAFFIRFGFALPVGAAFFFAVGGFLSFQGYRAK